MSDFLQLQRLTKRFGTVLAMDNVDIAIGAGEFFALLGPSGCGKTTLLRMVAGFEFPDAGSIFIDSADVTALPPEKRPTNMVFQSYAIFPHLNVFDNVAYGLRKARLGKPELVRRVDEALAMMRLEGMAARKSHELSGGQRQRVALARALVRRPKVLLLDEPLGALDRRLREAMQLELRALQKQVGITFLFVTHDQEEALSMADRVAVMSGGKVLQVATPRALYERPDAREVADFIGTMNFFDAIVEAREVDTAMVDAGVLGHVRIANAPSSATPGTTVTLAMRPEKIALASAGQTNAPTVSGSLTGTIASTTYLGERTHVSVAVEGVASPLAVTIPNDGRAAHTLAQGSVLRLSWPPDAIILLQ
jgi:spermidine/putrescine transport system ATP-binding protein/putrescine transport system ATP-binding protein